MTDVYRIAYETLTAAIRSAFNRELGKVENIAAYLSRDVAAAASELDFDTAKYGEFSFFVGMANSLRTVLDLVDRLDQDLAEGKINDLSNNIGGGK